MPMNLFDAIFQQSTLDRPAILFEQQQISYGELSKRTLAMANMLRGLEIERGDRVALLLNDSPEFVSSFIAICSYGAIAVPINMGLRADDQRVILNDCTARAAIVEASVVDSLLDGLPHNVPSLEHVILVARDASQNETPGTKPVKTWLLEELLAGSREDVASEKLFVARDDQPAFIFYTSGSTGEPKGAVHRQSDIFYCNQTYCREVLQLKTEDRTFSSSRLPFSYGFGNAFGFPLLNGCTTILCREKPTAEIIARIFNTYRPTIFFGVPVIYRSLLEHHRTVAPLDVSSLRFCVSAGEALPAPLGEEWQKTLGLEVLDGIGSTEMFHMWMSNHQGEVRYGSTGKLLKGYEAKLLDPEGGPVAEGVEGNLWVKGESAALGYWENPETTAATFVDGWVRTGDLYRCDREGFWFHMGRSDDCFKSSGQWVSPVEVEGVLLRHPGVRSAAVVADFDEDRLPCACAFVVRMDEAHVDLERSLRELARGALPRFKQPRRYIFVSELPYTATGKIQRYKLRKEVQSLKSRDKPKGN